MNSVKEVLVAAPLESASAVVLGTIGGSMAVACEIVRNNLALYWEIAQNQGIPMANIVLGQFNDMGAMLTFVAIGASAGGLFSKGDKEEMKEYMFIGSLVGGILSSLFYTSVEIYSIYKKNLPDGCGTFCRGDWNDVLSFSVPLIAAGIVGLHALAKRNS